MLTPDDYARYQQHIKLSEIGTTGQLKLKKARILCVGAGGLASPLLLYLAAAGVGTLGIVDDDVIETSNLQRQVLYRSEDIGKKKVFTAQSHLSALNPNITIIAHEEHFQADNAERLIEQYDVIADCTDNFTVRYHINNACFKLDKTFIFASIHQFAGQCAVFHPRRGPCFQCLFPLSPLIPLPSCDVGGVLGVLPGIMGALQATEILKYLLNLGGELTGRLISFDALQLHFKTIALQQDPQCPCCVLHLSPEENSLSVTALQNKLDNHETFTLIDVRTKEERERYHMGGQWIPLAELSQHVMSFDKQIEIIIYCQSGQRSLRAVQLFQQHNFSNVKSLAGGLKAWQNRSC